MEGRWWTVWPWSPVSVAGTVSVYMSVCVALPPLPSPWPSPSLRPFVWLPVRLSLPPFVFLSRGVCRSPSSAPAHQVKEIPIDSLYHLLYPSPSIICSLLPDSLSICLTLYLSIFFLYLSLSIYLFFPTYICLVS